MDADTSVTVVLSNFIQSGEYFWRVHAYDRGDNETINTGGWSRFEFENDPAGIGVDPILVSQPLPSRLWVEPNPVRDGAVVRWLGVVSKEGRATIFDVSGREVRRFRRLDGEEGSGAALQWYWNGKDRAGRRLPSGTYWIQYENRAAGVMQSARVVLTH